MNSVYLYHIGIRFSKCLFFGLMIPSLKSELLIWFILFFNWKWNVKIHYRNAQWEFYYLASSIIYLIFLFLNLSFSVGWRGSLIFVKIVCKARFCWMIVAYEQSNGWPTREALLRYAAGIVHANWKLVYGTFNLKLETVISEWYSSCSYPLGICQESF